MDRKEPRTWMSVEVTTWIAAGETAALLALLMFFREASLMLVAAVPLVLHLGWSAATSLPVGRVPGPPPGVGERRRNHLLRYQVREFLEEVQRVEAAAEKATLQGVPRTKFEKELARSGQNLQEIAQNMVKVAGRSGV